MWPPRAQAKIVDWTLDEIRPGDLVFSSKPQGADFIQRINDLSRHPWRHVAAVVDDGGERHVVEIDKNTFGYRPLTDFVQAFDRCGVARLGLDPACIDRATEWMREKVDCEHIYAWDDLLLAGLLALVTRGIFVTHRDQVRAALYGAYEAAKVGQESGAVDSFTCSGFIQSAYDEAGGRCAIVHEAWRHAPAWPPRIASLDELLGGTAGSSLAFADASLLELYELSLTLDCDGEWRPNKDQLGELVRVIAGAIGGWRSGDAPTRLAMDGRWITPSDLWTSASVSAKGYLSKPR